MTKNQIAGRKGPKKVAAAVLAGLVLATGITGPVTEAFAISSTDTHNLSISNAEAGVTAKVYKITTVNWDDKLDQPVQEMHQWANQSLSNWVSKNFPQYHGDRDREVSEQFVHLISDEGALDSSNRPVDNGAAAFYDRLSQAIKAGVVTGLETQSVNSAADGTITVPNKTMGSYLALVDGGAGLKVYRPMVLTIMPHADEARGTWTLDTSRASGIAKFSEMPITKNVNDHTTEMNQVLDWTVETKVPVYPNNAVDTTFSVSDKMPAGLTYNEGSLKIVGIDSAGRETVLANPAHYGVSKTDPRGNAVDFAANFKYDAVKNYVSVRLEYSSTVNGNAVVGPQGNTNNAQVTYVNDPYVKGSFQTQGDDETVFTYGVDITKVAQDGTTLSGAIFKIREVGFMTFDNIAEGDDRIEELAEGEERVVPADEFIGLVKVRDGVYRKATGTDNANVITTEAAVDANGKLRIIGLHDSAYEIEEHKAPHGFIKLADPIRVEIIDNNEDGIVDQNPVADNQGVTGLSVVNRKAFKLPMTGDAGSIGVIVAGAAAMAGGLFVTARMRKGEK